MTAALHRMGAAAGAFAAFYLALATPALSGAWPPQGIVVASLILMVALVALSTIDLFHQRLPDLLTLPLIFAGLTVSTTIRNEYVLERVLSAALAHGLMFLVAVVYERLRDRPGLGLGDAKLFAAAGAWVGYAGLAAVLLLASGAALTAVLLAAVFGRQATLATRIPFGPFLAFGIWIVWLYGPID
jgi:leader peptidase (prepilin peptidase) / N-methyltransferase